MMEDEVVSRRGWLTRERFLDFWARPISSLVRILPRWRFMWGLGSGRRPSFPAAALLTGGTGLAGIPTPSSLVIPFGLTALFLVFLKIGAILFGGGYVLLALIRSNLVTRLGWISQRQLLDAIAVGQMTPGPHSTD
jgi:hypothetical protein